MPRTHHSNRFSTTLSAVMGATSLNASVVTTAGSPISPCYLVIDHDVPASAEIILFDGLFDGTTFRTTVLANRYLAGSAAASGLSHAAGAKVISAPLGTSLEDIWDQVEAEAAAADAHAAATSVHAATWNPEASRIILRDSAARAKVQAPSTFDDIARKDTVDAHANATTVHSATSAATASRLVLRDASGRAQVAHPTVDLEIATKGYVDGSSSSGSAWVSLATPSGWSLSGGRRRKIGGVVYVIGGWVRVSGSNPTSPTFDTLPAGWIPADLVPILFRHGSSAVLTGFIDAAGAIVMDSATVAAAASVRFAVAFPVEP